MLVCVCVCVCKHSVCGGQFVPILFFFFFFFVCVLAKFFFFVFCFVFASFYEREILRYFWALFYYLG